MLTEKEIEQQILYFKQSILQLKENLERLNYEFGNYDADSESVIQDPDPQLSDKISYIEKKVGNLPYALKCFYQHIGGVNFQGFHPFWKAYCPDPLRIDGIDAAVEECDTQNMEEQDNTFYFPISPDYLHKEELSGGVFYHIELPSSEANPPLILENQSMPFLDYLLFSIKWGGFPGLAENPSHNWPVEKIKLGIKDYVDNK